MSITAMAPSFDELLRGLPWVCWGDSFGPGTGRLRDGVEIEDGSLVKWDGNGEAAKVDMLEER